MNIYKKPTLELFVCGEDDIVRTSGLPDNPYQGQEVGGVWSWGRSTFTGGFSND